MIKGCLERDRRGSHVAYIANQRIFLRALSEQESRPIAGSESPNDRISGLLFSPDNGVTHPIVDGKSSTTGYEIESHATSLDPGKMPHPPHRHAHDEMFIIRSGVVELTLNGEPHRLGPGSVALASNNDEHGIKNVGTEVAEYVIVAMGHR
jgi:mannose-6-phosphate isomerase-like protein (cupin superfamily)